MKMIKTILKPFIADSLGMIYFFTRRKKLFQALTVFCYHDVAKNPSEFSRKYDLNILPEIFEFQIRFIKDKFNIIGPKELLAGEVPEKAAMITFDDGFKSYFSTAVPIMSKYNVPSIIFLNMEPVLGGVFWSGLIIYLCQDKNFIRYLKDSVDTREGYPYFLYCSRELVEGYLKKNNLNLDSEIKAFVGEFASENDLREYSYDPLVFYGNHLYNHEVPRLMGRERFSASFENNEARLKRYSNYCNMFSFPFGQEGSCYSEENVQLAAKYAKRIFSSSGKINNKDLSSLDRVAVTSFHANASKMWFQICRGVRYE